jgi:hypothetical protein
MDELIQLLEEASSVVSEKVSSAPNTAMKSQLNKAAMDLHNLAMILLSGAYSVAPPALPRCDKELQDVLNAADGSHGEVLAQAREAYDIVRSQMQSKHAQMQSKHAAAELYAATPQNTQLFSLEREIPPDYLPPRPPRWPTPPIDWPRWPLPPYPPGPWLRPRPWPLPPWWHDANIGRDSF